MNKASQIIKVGTSRQVAIPKKVFDRLCLHAGDYLEVEVKRNKIILTPKEVIERRLAEGLKDIKEGRVVGPFSSGKEIVDALKK